MLRCLSLGLLASAVAIAPLPLKAQDGDSEKILQDSYYRINDANHALNPPYTPIELVDSSIPMNNSEKVVIKQDDEESLARNAIGVEIGTFNSSPWFPYTVNQDNTEWQYNPCNSLYLCSETGFYGGLINVNYIRRLLSSKQHSLDLDISGGGGWQSPQIKKSFSKDIYFVESYKGGSRKFFGMLSLIPTYRLQVFDWLSLGAGAGINYVIGELPSDIQGQNLNAAAKLELAFRVVESNEIEFTFTLNHRCAFFGTLNETKENSGSNWYTLGIRKWF